MTPGLVAWFTGLSGSGKTTIANGAAKLLSGRGVRVEIVDGDDIRRSQARHLGFSPEDVAESNEIAIQICAERRQGCDVVFVPRISPSRRGRQIAGEALNEAFAEIYVHASPDTVARRDPKGLYERARKGDLEALIGMPGGLPFEAPEHPDLVLDTETLDEDTLANTLAGFVTAWLSQRGTGPGRQDQSTQRRPA